MNIIYKIVILLTKNQIFSSQLLRNLRWWAYRKYFNTPLLYVAEYVKIVKAHPHDNTFFKVGNDVHIGEYAYIDFSGGVEIQNSVAISQNVKIFTHNHNVHGEFKDWNKNPIKYSSLLIEDYAWIGSNSIILESVSCIAEGSIVAAGSVLTKNTEPYGIYPGNPAKKIGTRVVDENK